MSVNIQQKDGTLLKISGSNNYYELENAPNIVNSGDDIVINNSTTIDSEGNIEAKSIKVDEISTDLLLLNNKNIGDVIDALENKTDNISSDSSSDDEFVIQDGENNIIARINKDGLETTKVTVSQVNLPNSNFTGHYQELSNKPPISDYDNSDEFVIQDGENNVIARIDKDGLETTKLHLKSLESDEFDGDVASAIIQLNGAVKDTSNLENLIKDSISAVVGDASDEGNTLGKLEDRIEVTDSRTAGISAQEDAEFIIQDGKETPNIIARFDKDGLFTTDIHLNDLSSSVANSILNNEGRLNIIQGDSTQEGSIKHEVNTLKESVNSEFTKVNEYINSVHQSFVNLVLDAPENYDTLKEISDYIAEDKSGAADMIVDINTLKNRTDGISSEEDARFIIQDNANNILAIFDKDGLRTTRVFANSMELEGLGSVASLNELNLLREGITSGSVVAAEAIKATNDSKGNNIFNTYETKTDASAKLNEAKGYTDAKFASLTANKALISNSEGKITASEVSNEELGFLQGVTSNIQNQLNNKSQIRIHIWGADD